MESIARISSLLETARDLTLEAARDAAPRTAGRSAVSTPQQIKKLLDERNERDILEGLRKVIAMQYANPPQPTLTFFPAVLKTLSTPYPSTRPLVYSYLLNHAEADPDTALLGVNTIQKSLGDSNPRIRAMALKTMSGIRVPVLSQIVSLAIKRGVADLSPIVRKAAALACVKCVRLDATTQPQVEDYLANLLKDRQYFVAGAAIQAFLEVCPDRLDLIHPVYRRLCKMIVDMDEWGQLAMLRLMTTYSRKCFPRRTKKVKKTGQTEEDKTRDFYEDLDQEASADYDDIEDIDPDLELFLKSVQPLLQSRNGAVILAVAKAYLYLSPTTYLPYAVSPLMALLRSSQDIQQVAIQNIVQITILRPDLLQPYTRHFLLHSSDTPIIRRLKLEILTLTFPHSSKGLQDLVLAELEHFSHASDSELVRDSVRAIGRCAQTSAASTSRRCIKLLLRQIHSPDGNLVGEAIDVVRHLIQRSPEDHRKTIVRLAKNLDTLTSPVARANVVWLVGDFAASDSDGIAADVLRLLVRGYADEDDEVKAQIVLLAAKVYLHHLNAQNTKKQLSFEGLVRSSDDDPTTDPDQKNLLENEATLSHDPIHLLWNHVLLLARYTPSYDLRDRARTYRALLSRGGSTELASLLLLAPKPVPLAPSPGEARRKFPFGSASLVIGEEIAPSTTTSSSFLSSSEGRGKANSESVPEWVEAGDEPDPKLRDVALRDEDGGGGIGSSSSSSSIINSNNHHHGSMGISAGRQLDEALRADENERGIAGSVSNAARTASKKNTKSLDDWLDEESSSSAEEDEEDEDDEEEEEEETTSEAESDEETDEKSGSEEDEDDDEDDDDDDDDENAKLVH